MIVLASFGAFAQQQTVYNDYATANTISQKSNTAPMVQHRVVMQMTSKDTLVWKSLMNNIKNLKAGWGDSVEIEVVMHGHGIEMLIAAKTTQQKKIEEFTKMGVVFVGCENTLRERNIPRESLVPEAGTVKMGIGEVIMKQEQGWSYIKLGF